MATDLLPSQHELNNCPCFDTREKSNPCPPGNRGAEVPWTRQRRFLPYTWDTTEQIRSTSQDEDRFQPEICSHDQPASIPRTGKQHPPLGWLGDVERADAGCNESCRFHLNLWLITTKETTRQPMSFDL